MDKPGQFDEVVSQDGVQVLIDSKALFSIIGSEMDWNEDSLRCVCIYHLLLEMINNLYDCISSKFVFKNPNIKDVCGCGESFKVKS